MIRFVRDDEPAGPIDLRPARAVEEGPVWEFHDPSAGGHALLVLPADPGAIPVSRYRDFPT